MYCKENEMYHNVFFCLKLTDKIIIFVFELPAQKLFATGK
jgi:hypothetical protein